jgi:hypothetical protein
MSASFDFRYSCPACETETGLYRKTRRPLDLEKPSPEAVEAQSGVESWSTTPGFDEADAEELRVWSGALPAIINAPARPWNGRALTERERLNARWVYVTEGPQAAYEWLSEHAR